jgi:hypothetical protein
MCSNCTTPAATQAAARAAFKALLAGITLTRYKELNVAAFKPLSTQGFSPLVRNYILAKVPKLPAEFTPVVCGYCGKNKDVRSVELDHIIPVMTYVRYKLWQTYRGTANPSRSAVRADADQFYTNPANLVFACKKCNKNKLDKMPDVAMPRDPASRQAIEILIHHARLGAGARLLELLETERDLRAIMAPTVCGRYMRGELMMATRGGRIRRPPMRLSASTRHAPMGPSVPAAVPASLPAAAPTVGLVAAGDPNFIPGTIDALLSMSEAALAAIEGVLSDKFRVSRPNIKTAMGPAWHAQLAAQTGAATVRKDLRFCIYCLGLFKKQAFQIEHVSAIRRSAITETDEKKYNDKLLAVCGTCNGSRQDDDLTDAFLAAKTAERIADNLPGIEAICLDWANDAAERARELIHV